VVITSFLGCKKTEDNFPPEPRIEFRDMVNTGNTLDVTIYFEDGDGDISQITLIPYVRDAGSTDIGKVIFWDSVQGRAVLVEKEDTTIYNSTKISYSYNINDLEPVSSNGSMKGTVTYSIDAGEVEFLLSLFPQQKIYFRILLYDRKNNKAEASTPNID
jgi:hypothetical protein